MTSTSTVSQSARKAPVTHKDLTIAFYLSGISEVARMVANHTNATEVLGKVSDQIRAKGQDSSEIDALRDTFADANVPGQRGRKPVAVGESRSFKVQQIEDKTTGEMGDTFLRLPVGPLNVPKGASILATYEDGRIVLTLA